MQRLVLTTAICCLVCAGSAGQQNQSGGSPDASSASAQSPTAPQQNNPVQTGMVFFQLLERRSRVFPDLATNTGPLDGWQKFKLAANNSVALSTIGTALIASAYGQAVNSPAGYRQGGEGYAKRFGADLARAASANLFGTFLIASVLQEDPRFYVKKNLSFQQSVKYSVVRVAIARSDSGKPVINFGGLLGPLAGEVLANTYYPRGNQGVGNTFIRYTSDLGWKFGGNLLRQYWPKINRKLQLLPSPTQSALTPNK